MGMVVRMWHAIFCRDDNHIIHICKVYLRKFAWLIRPFFEIELSIPDRNPLNGEKLLKVSLAIFTIISIIIHIYHKFTLSIDVMHSLLSAVYTVPWTRANPYLLGTMSAIYLRKNNYCPNIAQVNICRAKTNKWQIFNWSEFCFTITDDSNKTMDFMRNFHLLYYAWTKVQNCSLYRGIATQGCSAHWNRIDLLLDYYCR